MCLRHFFKINPTWIDTFAKSRKFIHGFNRGLSVWILFGPLCVYMSACSCTVLLCFGLFCLFSLSWDNSRILILMLNMCLCSHVNGSGVTGLFSYTLKKNCMLDSGLTCPTCCSVGEESCSTQKSTIVYDFGFSVTP